MSAIELEENGEISYDLGQVEWLVPLSQDYSLAAFYKALEDHIRTQSLVAVEYDDVVSLCKEISKIECLGYLDNALYEHQLSYKLGEKTHAVIVRLLESYTVSQAYYFIWKAAKDAAAFLVRSGTNKGHAARTVVGNIEKSLERAAAQNWNVSSYRRWRNLPQSVVNRVLFNLLLGTDDGGFSAPLCEIL